MIGILVVSRGRLAEAMISSARNLVVGDLQEKSGPWGIILAKEGPGLRKRKIQCILM